MIFNRKQFFSILLITGITFLLVYAFQANTGRGRINKSVLKKLSFTGEIEREIISFDSTQATVIVWFHPECELCCYQLDVINRNINRFYDIRLLLLTDEKELFNKKFIMKWPGLLESSSVKFGIIEKSKFVETFGPVLTPSLFFINHRGILKEKLFGEVKFEKIIKMIEKYLVPDQKRSGFN